MQRSKKGIMLSQAFGAVLTLVLVAVLVIISIYLFTTLRTPILSGASNNASAPAVVAVDTMVTQFGTFPALVGLVGTIIFLSLVIGVLIASFAMGGRKGV